MATLSIIATDTQEAPAWHQAAMRLLPGVRVLIGAMPEEHAFGLIGGLLLTVAQRGDLSPDEFRDRLRQMAELYRANLAPGARAKVTADA